VVRYLSFFVFTDSTFLTRKKSVAIFFVVLKVILSAIANLAKREILAFAFFRALIPVGEGVLGSAQLTVGDIAHFQPALVAADPASG